MSQVTTYTCDRCKRQVKALHELYVVQLLLRQANQQRSIHDDVRIIQEWCRPCLEQFAIVRSHMTEKEREQRERAAMKVPPAEPCMEDIVREICREEIADATGAQ